MKIKHSRRSPKSSPPNALRLWADIEDHLVPAFALSPGDRVIYFWLLRATRLRGRKSVWTSSPEIGRATMFADGTVRSSLHRLARAGILRTLNCGHRGQHIHVRLPGEVPEGRRHQAVNPARDFETINFLSRPKWRLAIYRREKGRCFYCQRQLNRKNRVFDHVVPRVHGGNDSYRNLVASCTNCNSSKRGMKAVDFLRHLLRQRVMTSTQYHRRLKALHLLKRGKLQPQL